MPKSSVTYGSAPVPEEVLRKPVTSFSYEDVWAEEHAVSFTVAKGMQLDVVVSAFARKTTYEEMDRLDRVERLE